MTKIEATKKVREMLGNEAAYVADGHNSGHRTMHACLPVTDPRGEMYGLGVALVFVRKEDTQDGEIKDWKPLVDHLKGNAKILWAAAGNLISHQ